VIQLNQGSNTIKFYKDTAWASNIDRILLTPGNLEEYFRLPYDWTITKEPERPYMMDYSKTLLMKMRLSTITVSDYEGSVVNISLDQALTNIQRLDNLTMGVPKVIYLGGWQYNGHDSKYPSWGEVNPLLKRAGDATAWDSLRWLVEEDKQYNTTVSLHINMYDAFTNSPDFQFYADNYLLNRDLNGNLIQGEMWEGGQAYLVNHHMEWESGYAKKRIDDLIAKLPSDLHTIHIDMFRPTMCPHIRELHRTSRRLPSGKSFATGGIRIRR
jgi:hypothetical protein